MSDEINTKEYEEEEYEDISEGDDNKEENNPAESYFDQHNVDHGKDAKEPEEPGKEMSDDDMDDEKEAVTNPELLSSLHSLSGIPNATEVWKTISQPPTVEPGKIMEETSESAEDFLERINNNPEAQ